MVEDISHAAQDMDISPGDSTPTSSEVSYHQTMSAATTQPILIVADQQNSHVGPVLLANALPRLISHPIQQHMPTTSLALVTTCASRPEMSPLASTQPLTLSSPVTGIPASVIVTTVNAPGPPSVANISPHPSMCPPTTPDATDVKVQTVHGTTIILNRQAIALGSVAGDNSGVVLAQPLTVETNHGGMVEGPPTPTHSETADCIKGELILVILQHWI